MFSMDPNPSRCAGAMFVIKPWVGNAMLHKFFISPGILAPISTIAKSWCGCRPNKVKQRPIVVLKFPIDALILNWFSCIILKISLVSTNDKGKEHDRDDYEFKLFLKSGSEIVERETNMFVSVPVKGKAYIGLFKN